MSRAEETISKNPSKNGSLILNESFFDTLAKLK
jgi:hypothetical protein